MRIPVALTCALAGLTIPSPSACQSVDAALLARVVEGYVDAWNEPDPEKRGVLLDAVWAEDGVYTDPTAHLEGREELHRHITGFLAQIAGGRIELASGVDEHHGLIRFRWRILDGHGREVAAGMDFGRMTTDGRLGHIVGFFGPFPPESADP